jgi:hypothetical protein
MSLTNAAVGGLRIFSLTDFRGFSLFSIHLAGRQLHIQYTVERERAPKQRWAGGGGAQRIVFCLHEPKQMGERITRARSAIETHLSYRLFLAAEAERRPTEFTPFFESHLNLSATGNATQEIKAWMYLRIFTVLHLKAIHFSRFLVLMIHCCYHKIAQDAENKVCKMI